MLDDLVRNANACIRGQCWEFYCADGSGAVDNCVQVELMNLVPSAQWLACAARVARADPAVEAYLGALSMCRARCAQAAPTDACAPSFTSDLRCPPAETEPPALAACPDFGRPQYCPGTAACLYFTPCDGAAECPDGFDERNCDPSAARFDCGDGSFVPWLSLCDGVADCPNGSDELRCSATISSCA
jgi:hypothetical protein